MNGMTRTSHEVPGRGAGVGPAIMLALLGLLLIAGCIPTADVIQGKVTAVEPGGAVIRVQNDLAPDASPVAIDISKAEIGITPAVGDEVRVAYNLRGGICEAVRVMNVTRDKERQRSGR